MKPQTGETVRVDYTGTLADGSQFDSSAGRAPLEFTVGQGMMIPGFEAAVIELEPGESVTVTIPAAEAYGERMDQAVQQAPREIFGGDIDTLEPGLTVHLANPDGQQFNAQVVGITDEHVVLDFNHPLAGQDLTFAITLVEVVGR